MDTLSLEEVCGLLKISAQTGRNRLSRGCKMPPSFRVGRRRLFLKEEVAGWLKQQAGINTQESASLNQQSRRGRPRG